jgi:uncharacterized protein
MRRSTTVSDPWVTGRHTGDRRVEELERAVRSLYASAGDSLPFHGWHHVDFVTTKAVEFARARDADPSVVAAAALVHDMNYLVRRNSAPKAGRMLRHKSLADVGYDPAEINRVEQIIDEAHTATRTAKISPEGSALSDADTLFKALPMTPVVFSHLYLTENGVGLRELGRKILREQLPLVEHGIYFYDHELRERYLPWARTNILLWQQIMASLDDPDVVTLLDAVHVKPLYVVPEGRPHESPATRSAAQIASFGAMAGTVATEGQRPQTASTRAGDEGLILLKRARGCRRRGCLCAVDCPDECPHLPPTESRRAPVRFPGYVDCCFPMRTSGSRNERPSTLWHAVEAPTDVGGRSGRTVGAADLALLAGRATGA